MIGRKQEQEELLPHDKKNADRYSRFRFFYLDHLGIDAGKIVSWYILLYVADADCFLSR